MSPSSPRRPRPAKQKKKAVKSARKPVKKPAVKPSKPELPVISLVLVDDNRLLRDGISAMIRSQPGFKILAAYADIDEAMDKVRNANPDIVLLDVGLEDNDSLALTTRLQTEVPTARIIIMGLLPAQEDVADYVRAGASGFIMKEATFEDFFQTIRAVFDGAEVLPKALTNTLFNQIAKNVTKRKRAPILESIRLTSRERQIIDLLGEGLANKEIASRLNIAVHTVKSHVHNVLEKLALRSRLEVVAFLHGTGDPIPKE